MSAPDCLALKAGVFPDVKMAAYLAVPAFSAGLAQTILAQSPLHAWTDSPWNPKREQDESGVADIGTYAHAMLLEGEHASLCVIEADDWRTKAAKEARESARAAGLLPILAHKVAEVEAMVTVAREYLATTELSGIFKTGAPEQTVIWQEGEIWCKARPDWLAEDRKISLSYKTTAGNAQPDAWIRTQLPGYDLGIVLYEAGIRATGGPEAVRVVTLVQEQKPPYGCCLVALAPAWQSLAQSRLDSALKIWRECLKTGKFPAYPTRICWAEPKPWQLAEAEEKELQGAFADPSKIWEKPE